MAGEDLEVSQQMIKTIHLKLSKPGSIFLLIFFKKSQLYVSEGRSRLWFLYNFSVHLFFQLVDKLNQFQLKQNELFLYKVVLLLAVKYTRLSVDTERWGFPHISHSFVKNIRTP